MASICNDERASLGVTSGHERKTLRLSGHGHSFGGIYKELVPHERLVYTATFDDPNLHGEMQSTITLTKVSCGTEMHIVLEGIPAAIPLEACYMGWQQSLVLLAQLVEPEIAG